MMYVDDFDVPVVYVNSKGNLEHMSGMMGKMMEKHGFKMNGKSHIYAHKADIIETDIPEAFAVNVDLVQHKRKKDIKFYGNDILFDNYLFRKFILNPDIKAGIISYEANR